MTYPTGQTSRLCPLWHGNRIAHQEATAPSLDFSRAHRKAKRKRGITHELSSLTLRLAMMNNVAKSPSSREIRVGCAWALSFLHIIRSVAK